MTNFRTLIFLFISCICFSDCFGATVLVNVPADIINSEIVKYDQKETGEEKPLIHSSGYFGLEFNTDLNMIIPVIGYRHQKNSYGFGVETGAQIAQDDLYYKLELNGYYFPMPSLDGQLFMGLGIDGQFLHRWVDFDYFDSEDYYVYSEFRKCKFFLLTPTLFIGQDFFLAKGQKLFAQVTFTFGNICLGRYGGLDFYKSLGFKIGYGF